MAEEKFEIARGDSFNLPIEITDEDDVAVDLTGTTVCFTARRLLKDDDELAEIKIDVPPGDHTLPLEGKTQIPLTSEATHIKEGEYYWDIRVLFVSGDILTFIPTNDKLYIVAHATDRTEPLSS